MMRATFIPVIIGVFLVLGIPAGNAAARPDSEMSIPNGTEDPGYAASPITITPSQSGTGASLVTFEYSVPAPGFVRVGIYDADGHLVALLADTYHDAGNHRTVWSTAGCPSGIYRCVLSAGPATQTRAVILQ